MEPRPALSKGDTVANAKVRMLVSLSGADGVFDAGDVYPCDEAEAKRLIAEGFADPISEKRVEKRPAKTAVDSREG